MIKFYYKLKSLDESIHLILDIPKRITNQRNGECACLLGTDIGTYDTCGHLCRYCYANSDVNLVKDNMKRHDPYSPFLIGNIMSDDVVHDAKQSSWIDPQMRLDL